VCIKATDVQVLVFDLQGQLMLDIMLGAGIEPALGNPSTLIPESWQASSEKLTRLGGSAW
jgi:hypothetical protein